MKIKDLIDRLKTLDPEGEVTGVEHLEVKTNLYLEAPHETPVGFYLKGKNRLDAASAPGTPEEVAKAFNVTTAYIRALRMAVAAGKIKL